jgi:hypothetical protein
VEFSDIVSEKVAVPGDTTSIVVFRDSKADMVTCLWPGGRMKREENMFGTRDKHGVKSLYL